MIPEFTKGPQVRSKPSTWAGSKEARGQPLGGIFGNKVDRLEGLSLILALGASLGGISSLAAGSGGGGGGFGAGFKDVGIGGVGNTQPWLGGPEAGAAAGGAGWQEWARRGARSQAMQQPQQHQYQPYQMQDYRRKQGALDVFREQKEAENNVMEARRAQQLAWALQNMRNV